MHKLYKRIYPKFSIESHNPKFVSMYETGIICELWETSMSYTSFLHHEPIYTRGETFISVTYF